LRPDRFLLESGHHVKFGLSCDVWEKLHLSDDFHLLWVEYVEAASAVADEQDASLLGGAVTTDHALERGDTWVHGQKVSCYMGHWVYRVHVQLIHRKDVLCLQMAVVDEVYKLVLDVEFDLFLILENKLGPSVIEAVLETENAILCQEKQSLGLSPRHGLYDV